MITSADFRAAVQDFIERSSSDQLPAAGEIMLIGSAAGGRWKRLRIRPYLGLVARLVVRGFLLDVKIDRLAIVSPGGASREFRVVFVEKDGIDDPVHDPRLAKLVTAVRREWAHPSGSGKPARRWFGRPYPIALLAAVLGVEALFDLLRVPWLFTGSYSWLPALPRLAAGILFAAYVTLVVITAATLWQERPGSYRLALALSAIQVLHSFAYYLPLVPYYGQWRVGEWILWSFYYPAAIWFFLLLKWVEDRRANLGDNRLLPRT